MSQTGFLARCLPALALLIGAPTLAQAIAVTSTTPASNGLNVARDTSIVVNFDRAVATGTVTSSSFRVWGTQSGPKTGTTVYSNGDQTLTYTPSAGFFPGETVSVQVAHSITGADATPMRTAGYAFQFIARTAPAAIHFSELDQVSVKLNGDHAQIYGGIATDLNGDGWVDYTGVNEVSSDLRVMLNSADGSGLFDPILTPPTPIGYMASPSTLGDLDDDGLIDIATSNSEDDNVTIAFSHGDGRFTPENIDVGAQPRSIAALDFDGDGDLDIAVASEFAGSNGAISLLRNDGGGNFTRLTDLAAPGNGKYGLAAGDMNGDGILDLVVGTADDNGGIGRMMILLGNGDGTFQQPLSGGGNVPAGGYVWKIALGDVNNDGKLDAVTVNSSSNTGSVFFGNGDGTFQNAQIYTFDGWMLGTTLGDLDGDGSLDWVNSNFGAGHWHIMHNDGTGHFTESQRIEAPANASCATLFDFDNNGTLDMVLADETSDIVLLEKNDGAGGGDTADVSVGMSAAPNQYTPGETLSYTITVTNTGPDASPVTHVGDDFPASLEGVTWTCAPSGGADCGASSGNGDLDEDVNLPSGGQVVYTVEGTVAAGASGTINNTVTATVGAPASDPDTSNNSITTHTQQAGLDADVAVALSANPTQYTAGEALTYTITVGNAGPDAAANTHVADNFPTAFTGASWSCVASGGASCAASGNGDIDEDVSIPSGGQVVFNVNGTVAANATGQLVNTVTATVGAPADDPNTSNNTVTLHTNPGNLPDEIFASGFDG